MSVHRASVRRQPASGFTVSPRLGQGRLTRTPEDSAGSI